MQFSLVQEGEQAVPHLRLHPPLQPPVVSAQAVQAASEELTPWTDLVPAHNYAAQKHV